MMPKFKSDNIESTENSSNIPNISPLDSKNDPAVLEEQINQLKHAERINLRRAIELEMELHSAKADRDLYKKRYLDAQAKLEQLTTTPLPVGTVERIVQDNKFRAVVKLISGQTFVCSYAPDLHIREGDIVALHQRSMAIIEVLPPLTDALVAAMEMIDRPTETYDDIGGLNDQLLEIREVIELSIKDPEAFKIFNITPPHGVLLYGPPGTGKTLVAKAVANATNAKFIRLAAPELVQKFIGEGARLVREIFKTARENAPAVIFIDEIDAIAAKRTEDSQSGEREVNRTLMQLLAEMDGFTKNSNIPIIAATNRIDILDPAILRPGRFDRIIQLPLPAPEARKNIFEIHCRSLPLSQIIIPEIIEKSEGLSGADIKAVCTEAAMFALRDRLSGKNRNKVNHKDFVAAIEKVKNKLREAQELKSAAAKALYS